MKKGNHMEFDKYFNIKTIIPSLEAKSKQEVISALVEIIEKENKIPEGVNILSSIIERESIDSTGLGNGLALPHAGIRDLNKIITAVARIPDGVDFVAQDRKPVFFSIMICYPPTQSFVYLSLISSISKVFHKKENIQTIMKQTTAKAIYEKLIELLNQSYKSSELSPSQNPPSDNEKQSIEISSSTSEIHLLIRLQQYEEDIKNSTRGKKQLQQKVDNLRSLISEKNLQHYDKLKGKRPPAVVTIEGDRCHGCHMTLHTDFIQRIQQEPDSLHTCPKCRRFVYWV